MQKQLPTQRIFCKLVRGVKDDDAFSSILQAENSCQVTFKRIAKVDVHWHVYLPVRPHRMIGKLLNGVKDDGTY